MASAIPEMGEEDTAVVLLGHGSHHFANAIYAAWTMCTPRAMKMCSRAVEGFPTIDQVIANVTAFGNKNGNILS